MKYEENIKDLGTLLPDFMGFIFYKKSPRFVKESLSVSVLQNLPNSIKKVGVFVNEELETVLEKVSKYQLNLVQLHGNESVEFCAKIQQKYIPIIKAFQVDESFDFNTLSPYKTYVDYFLFDTKSKHYGGSGKKFNWELLQNYDNDIPIFLSGGISIEDISELKKNTILKKLNIAAIDVNSKFETAAAIKDILLISAFKKQLQNELQSR